MADHKEDLRSILKKLETKAVQSAARRALNKAATSVRSEMSRRVRTSIKVKAKDIKDQLTIVRAKSGPISRISSKIEISQKGIPLHAFSARQKRVKTNDGPRVGVTVNVTGKRTLVKGGFLAVTRTGKTTILRRGPKRGAYQKEAPRTPAWMLFGPSVANVATKKPFIKSILKFARDRTKATFEQEARFELSKLGD